jgi:hypothetical protein
VFAECTVVFGIADTDLVDAVSVGTVLGAIVVEPGHKFIDDF